MRRLLLALEILEGMMMKEEESMIGRRMVVEICVDGEEREGDGRR